MCSVLVSDEDIKNERQRFSINLVGLKKNAQYKTRVKAHTSLPGAAGDGGTWSQNGDPSALFRTNEDAPSKGSLPTLTSTSSRTIEAKWDKPSFPNGEITKYDVQYSEANVNATVWKTSVATAETYTLENLEPHTKYVVRIVPYTKIAPGPMSDTAEIQTKEDKPETPKNAPTVSKSRGALKSTSFVVEWNAVSAADANGVVLGYTVSVKQKTNRRRRAANGDIVYNKFVAGTGTTRDITGLTPATTYDVTVTARTAGGDSAASPPMYATTLDAAPEAPETPSLRAVTSKSILAQWRPPNVTNGEITGFAVSYKEYLATASNASNATLYATFNTSAFRLDALIEGLKPATEYVVHVRAFTALAASPQSTENRIATKDDQPSAVQCKATTVSSSRIDVSWAPPTTPNGAIQGYEVFVTSKVRVVSGYAPVQNMTDDLVLTTNANTLSARHDKLEPYTTYTYSVRARTSAGASTLDLMSSSKTLSALPAGQSPPTVRAIGATKAEIIWSKPKFPNGEITKYELHLTQEEGEVPTFSGIPAKQKDGKYTMNITGLEADTTYEFTLTSFTAIGPSVRSFRTVVRMGSTTPSAAVATLVATLCIFVIVLSLGFMWEHRTRTRRLRENSVEPDGNLKNPLSNGKQNMDAMFGTNQTAFRGNVPAANDDDSSSGSSFGTDSDDDDDESRA